MSVVSTKNFKIFRNLTAISKVWGPSTVQKCYSTKYYSGINPLPTKYGGKTNITVLPGVGIGPEIMDSTLEVLNAARAPLSYEIMHIRPENEVDDFENVLTSIRRNKIAIKANIETQSKDPQVRSRNISLRKLLDLYVFVLPVKSYPGVPTKFQNLDIVMVRQNTEGEYLMLEHEPIRGSVESLKVITRYNTERLAEFAYRYALINRRKSVTVVHTAAVQQLTEGLFLQSVVSIADRYPQIETRISDARQTIADLLHSPQLIDVVIASNLNGGMISNIINGMLGGPALSAGINLNDTGIAIFEPGARNKGSGIVNKGIANPSAMLMAAAKLLRHLGHSKTATIIDTAIYRTIVHDKILSQDLGGVATTKQITENIIRHVKTLTEKPDKFSTLAKVKYKRWHLESLQSPDLPKSEDAMEETCPLPKDETD